MGSQRVGHDWATSLHFSSLKCIKNHGHNCTISLLSGVWGAKGIPLALDAGFWMHSTLWCWQAICTKTPHGPGSLVKPTKKALGLNSSLRARSRLRWGTGWEKSLEPGKTMSDLGMLRRKASSPGKVEGLQDKELRWGSRGRQRYKMVQDVVQKGLPLWNLKSGGLRG